MNTVNKQGSCRRQRLGKQERSLQTSLLIQQSICLAMQGTQVQFLVGIIGLGVLSLGTTASESVSCNERSRMTQ